MTTNLPKIVIPMIRRTFPQLITNYIVGVQPMTGRPVGRSLLITPEEYIKNQYSRNQIIGIIENDVITIRWRGKKLKQRLTREEWDKRYFVDNL